jgi:hypothetical protein
MAGRVKTVRWTNKARGETRSYFGASWSVVTGICREIRVLRIVYPSSETNWGFPACSAHVQNAVILGLGFLQGFRVQIRNRESRGNPDPTQSNYRIIWRISRPAYSMVRCGRRGLGDGLGEGLGFPKCKFKREDNKRRVLRSEKVEIPWTGFGEL